MPLHVWSSAHYVIPLPHGHRFPIDKYGMLCERLTRELVVLPEHVHDAERISLEALHRVHSERYVRDMVEGTLPPAAVRKLGFPWSAALLERSRRSVGGTLAAARHALEFGVAMNLAGGTHHAFADHGEGFCVFNDVAIAIRTLQTERLITRAVVIDLDVHQGNGTHEIFAGEADVFTFSMHGRRNYPFTKVAGTLDIELDDATGDALYLALLAEALPRVVRDARADIAFFLAGADPLTGDKLGRLSLSSAGLRRRDDMVLEQCRAVGLPVAITIAGGYGARIEDTVDVHVGTARVASAYC